MDRIKELRNALGLTQKQFAERLGATFYQGEIARLESDKTTTLTGRQLLAINQAFNVSVDWLATGAGSMFLDDREKERQRASKIRPYNYAIAQGFGDSTARAFASFCKCSDGDKEAIEALFSSRDFQRLLSLFRRSIAGRDPLPPGKERGGETAGDQ